MLVFIKTPLMRITYFTTSVVKLKLHYGEDPSDQELNVTVTIPVMH